MARSKQSKACDISQAVRKKVWERDGGRCIICGNNGLGGHTMKNLYEELDTMCLRCECRGDLKCGTVAHCKGE